jgi:hypothetical protein
LLTEPANNKPGTLKADVRGILMFWEFLVGGGKPLAAPCLGMALRHWVLLLFLLLMMLMIMMVVVVVVLVVLAAAAAAAAVMQ